MSLDIRIAQASDIPAIHNITQAAFEKYARDLGLPKQVSALKEDEGAIQEEMKHKTILMARLEGTPVGVLRYEWFDDSIVYISRFGVLPDLHNCGVGKALIQTAEQQVRAEGAALLALHTGSKMTSLVRFYYGMGFYIHSTAFDRGYVRGLFIKELKEGPLPALQSILAL